MAIRQSLTAIPERPRCKQSVAQHCSNLNRLNGTRLWPGSMAESSHRMPEAVLAPEAWEAARLCRTTGKAARLFRDFAYQTETSWSRPRRVVGKAEHLPDGANPRFVVTSLGREKIDARGLYEDLYCARGEMENRIKECQLDLFADRTSSATMQANQLRLWFASMAYVLLSELRRIALRHTQFADATCGTIRLKLLKIGALVRPPHPVCRCHLRHHPAEAVEDRCPGPS